MNNIFKLKIHLITFLLLIMARVALPNSDESSNDDGQMNIAEAQLETSEHRITQLCEKVKVQPLNASFHYDLGVTYLNTASFQKAILHLERARSLDADESLNNDLLYWIGKAYHQNQQFEAAFEYYNLYDRAIDRDDVKKKQTQILKMQAAQSMEYVEIWSAK